MRPADLLADFEQRGFRFFVRDDQLLVAPSDELTEEEREAIRVMRPQLIGLVKSRALSFPTPPSRCPVCGYVAFYQSLADETWGCTRCFPAAARHARVVHISPAKVTTGEGHSRDRRPQTGVPVRSETQGTASPVWGKAARSDRRPFWEPIQGLPRGTRLPQEQGATAPNPLKRKEVTSGVCTNMGTNGRKPGAS